MLRTVAVLSLLLASCAHPRPVLYPDENLKAAGLPAAQEDADDCLAQAKEYLKANPAKRVARRAGRGGVFGAVMGAVFGAFTGNYTRAISEGAAVGAAGGAMQGAWESGSPDHIQRGYTERCLSEKGYSVIGWK